MGEKNYMKPIIDHKLFQEISSIGAKIVTPPKYYPEYGPTYYALFFKDTENIKYEIVFK
jgi:hypothetical protein